MHKIDYKAMIKDFYANAFSSTWGETWYLDVIKPVIMSAEKNEKLYFENNKSSLLNNNEILYEEIIETQIGLVLILSQTYITRVIGIINNFQQDLKSLNCEKEINFENKKNLMAKCSPKYKNTKFTYIEAIDHLANYFKHHDDWSENKSNAPSKRTKQAVIEMGLNIDQSLWLSRNLSNAIKGLEITKLSDLPKMMSIIDNWKNEIGILFKNKALL